MKLFIRIKDGKPFEHPISEDNFRQVFPEIDTDNLPIEFARFERVERPSLGIYEVYEDLTYEWVDGVVKDVHHSRPMTDEEKMKKQSAVIEMWAQHGYRSWTFNKEICSFEPPTPMPKDAGTGEPPKMYLWDEATTSWVVVETEGV